MRAERLRATRWDALRRLNWLEDSIKVEIKPSSQSYFFETNNYSGISELVTKMFYPRFLLARKNPEKVKPITFTVEFDLLNGQ